MNKVLEGEGEVMFRAFPVGIPILPPSPAAPTTATPNFLCHHVSDERAEPDVCVCMCNADLLVV